MKFGYVRESMDENDLDFQIDALENYGVDEIYVEYPYSKKTKKTRLEELIEREESMSRKTRKLYEDIFFYFRNKTIR